MLPGSSQYVGQLVAPAGTRCLFHQAATPLGWVLDTTLTDHALQVVTSAGGGTGGSVNCSSWRGGGTFNATAVSLSLAQLPSHGHTITDNGHTHTINGGANFYTTTAGTQLNSGSNLNFQTFTGYATTGISGTSSAGSGSPVTFNFTTPSVKYAAMVVGQKS